MPALTRNSETLVPPAAAATAGRGALYRIRRYLRELVRGPVPAKDGWKPAGGAVLVIAPHPDDEVIGCGGTIQRHVSSGDHAICVYLTRGEKSRGYPWFTPEQRQAKREQEGRDSSRILGFKELIFLDGTDGGLSELAETRRLQEKLATILAEKKPRIIYVPHAEDKHADHVAAFQMIQRLVGDAAEPAILQYELWSPLAADVGVDITRQMPAKIRAIRCHELAMDAFDYVPTMKGLAAYRSGTLLQRKGYAEAFRHAPVVKNP